MKIVCERGKITGTSTNEIYRLKIAGACTAAIFQDECDTGMKLYFVVRREYRVSVIPRN